MKKPAKYALVFEFDLKAPRKRQHSGSATLFRPYRKSTGESACRCVFRGIENEDSEIYGEDSLQALLLALFLLRFLFERMRRKGISIRYPGSREEIDIDLYFSALAKRTKTEPNKISEVNGQVKK